MDLLIHASFIEVEIIVITISRKFTVSQTIHLTIHLRYVTDINTPLMVFLLSQMRGNFCLLYTSDAADE